MTEEMVVTDLSLGESWPNAWTRGFVADLLRRPSLDGLTSKQAACVNRIIQQAYERGVRADRRAA